MKIQPFSVMFWCINKKLHVPNTMVTSPRRENVVFDNVSHCLQFAAYFCAIIRAEKTDAWSSGHSENTNENMIFLIWEWIVLA